jgi:hypothetical protein
MDLCNHTIIIDFNTLGHVYIDYNPLCRSDKTQRIAREVSLPFHQTLSHELGHYFDDLVFANLDFFRQDTGMLGFLSNSIFRNIFFPNVEYIPDFKNVAYEALLHPFLDCFKKISTEAFPDHNPIVITEDAESIFRTNFAEVSYNFMKTNVFDDTKRQTKDVTTLDLFINPLRSIPIDRELKMRSDSLIESLFLQMLYEDFSNSVELLRIHGLNVINLFGKKSVILDPCCDVTIAESEGRSSRWTHMAQYGSIITDKPIPEKSTIDQHIKKFVDNIRNNADALLQVFSNDVRAVISAHTSEPPVMKDSVLYYRSPLGPASLYKHAFVKILNMSLGIIGGENIERTEETDDSEKVYVGHLHSFVPEGDIQFLWDLRK